MINLICALALRNPRLRESLRDFHEQVVNRVFQVALETPERWANHVKSMGEGNNFSKLSFEEAKRFFEKADFSVTVPRERDIQIEVQAFNEMLPILLKRNWMLLKPPRRSGGFVTCDHPVVLMWSDLKMRGGFYGPGFGCTGTEVLFPICSRLAVVGAFELKNGPAVEVNESPVASFNGA